MNPVTAAHDVVVIGGGQAGLAIGFELAQQGRRFTILDAADEPAAAWRARWDSLTLFTPSRYDSLPGMQFPGDPNAYPHRDDVVAYLTEYARRFELPVELRSRVSSLKRGDGVGDGARYRIATDDGRAFDAHQVVVATGPFQVPRTPAIASNLHSDVFQIHSSEYRNPGALPPGPVLVVGGGNTGFQIAEELSATHEVHLAIGSRQAPLPQKLFGIDTFRITGPLGLITKPGDTRLGSRMRANETLVGYSPRKARRQGVTIRTRAVAVGGADVRFEDGSTLTPSAVVWATGFGVDHSWIDVPDIFDPAGNALHRRGVTDAPGLYFLGLQWLHSRGSALLGWVKHDAEYIAAQIDAEVPSARPAPAPAPATTRYPDRSHA